MGKLVQVSKLFLEDILVEIEATAVIRKKICNHPFFCVPTKKRVVIHKLYHPKTFGRPFVSSID